MFKHIPLHLSMKIASVGYAPSPTDSVFNNKDTSFSILQYLPHQDITTLSNINNTYHRHIKQLSHMGKRMIVQLRRALETSGMTQEQEYELLFITNNQMPLPKQTVFMPGFKHTGANLYLAQNPGHPIHQQIQDLIKRHLSDDIETLFKLAIQASLSEAQQRLVTHLIETHPLLLVARDAYGSTLLHDAAWHGNLTIITLLKHAGANINSRDEEGTTPLHKAIWNTHLLMIQYLLHAKADATAKDNEGETPLHVAAVLDEVAVIHVLLNAGADINAQADDGWSPLHAAAWNGNLGVVQALKRSGANMNIKNNEDETPLHWATEEGQLAIVNELIQAGVTVTARNKAGFTALDIAKEQETKLGPPLKTLFQTIIQSLKDAENQALQSKASSKRPRNNESDVDSEPPPHKRYKA